MAGTSRLLMLAALVGLSACAASDDRFGDPSAGYLADAGVVVAAADWSKAEKLSITLSEFAFDPAQITFAAGEPYELTIFNDGLVGHTIAAPTFFRAIAAKSLLYSDGESSFPILESIYVDPDEAKTLFFVPVGKGEFEFICDRPLHRGLGMEGLFRVE